MGHPAAPDTSVESMGGHVPMWAIAFRQVEGEHPGRWFS
jgi:hypothetical protein